MNRQKLLAKIQKEAKNKTMQEAASKLGVNYVTLWRVLRGRSRGSIVFWETIYEHYKPVRGNK